MSLEGGRGAWQRGEGSGSWAWISKKYGTHPGNCLNLAMVPGVPGGQGGAQAKKSGKLHAEGRLSALPGDPQEVRDCPKWLPSPGATSQICFSVSAWLPPSLPSLGISCLISFPTPCAQPSLSSMAPTPAQGPEPAHPLWRMVHPREHVCLGSHLQAWKLLLAGLGAGRRR